MTREEGKTHPEAKGEVRRSINNCRYFAGEDRCHRSWREYSAVSGSRYTHSDRDTDDGSAEVIIGYGRGEKINARHALAGFFCRQPRRRIRFIRGSAPFCPACARAGRQARDHPGP